MDYINNWQRPVALSAGQTSVALDLPDGTYRLTVADSPTAPTAWEIVDASVTAGTATLTRAQEGTQAANWGTGSVIYCSITAGTLSALQAATAPSFKPLYMLAEGDTLQLTTQRVHIFAMLQAGTGALTLQLPAVDKGSLMGAALEWDIALSIASGSSLIIQLQPFTPLGNVDLISNNPHLEVASYDAQTGQLTITGPAGGPGGMMGSIEASWADAPGQVETLLIALKEPDVPTFTSLYPSP